MTGITIERTDAPTPSVREDWTFYRVTGPRVRGIVCATVGNSDGEPTMTIDLAWTATDAHGRTEYRTADPEAFEVQSLCAVHVDPLSINGKAYNGRVRYRVDDPAKPRYTGGYQFADLTDAARRTVHEVAELVAADLVTPDTIHAAELRTLADKVRFAKDELDRAIAAHNAAVARYERARKRGPVTTG